MSRAKDLLRPTQDNPALQRTPWVSIGTLPADPKQLEELNKDPNTSRMASYGSLGLDSVIIVFINTFHM